MPWHYIDVRRDGAEAPDGRKGDSNESVPRRDHRVVAQLVSIGSGLLAVRTYPLRLVMATY